MSDLPDVDIEVLHRDWVADLFPEAHPASIRVSDRLRQHSSGIYFQDIPTDPDGIAALPHELAEENGFYKVDLLAAPFPYSKGDDIASMQELRNWMEEPVDWRWFTDVPFVATLFQLGGPVHLNNNATTTTAEVVVAYAPQSIEDLACLIALIRPGKKHMIGASWETIRANIWKRETRHYFKKSHAIAYALAVSLNAKRTALDYFSR